MKSNLKKEFEFNPETFGIFRGKMTPVLVIFIFTVRAFVRLFERHQYRQRSVLLILERAINLHSYKHYFFLLFFQIESPGKISDTVKICLTFKITEICFQEKLLFNFLVKNGNY